MSYVDELNSFRHVFYNLAETSHIGLVKWRIDLIEDTERRRVQFKDCEHQRYCRQRLFTTRHQMYIGNALARRSGHHGYAGTEHIIARHFQVSSTAAEQTREFLLELAVDVVVGILEAGARFLVNLGNGIFQRFQRRGYISMLFVKILLALLLFLVLVYCRKVDWPQT